MAELPDLPSETGLGFSGFPPALGLLRESETTPGLAAPEEEEEAWPDTGGGRSIVCRLCGTIVAGTGDRTEVNGSHEHSFFNPHGFLFELGCFAQAPGCTQMGSASSEFSWFRGYSWRIALCGTCLAHLGWAFLGAGTAFYGLILNRIEEREEE